MLIFVLSFSEVVGADLVKKINLADIAAGANNAGWTKPTGNMEIVGSKTAKLTYKDSSNARFSIP